MHNREYQLPLYGVKSPLAKLNRLENSSNKILQKKSDGSIRGAHYIISSEPSTLRPIKSWVIHIEEWSCNADSTMTAKDILFIRVLNHPKYDPDGCDLISEIILGDIKIDVTSDNAQNAMAAALVFISKIDAARMPDTKEILRLYNLS